MDAAATGMPEQAENGTVPHTDKTRPFAGYPRGPEYGDPDEDERDRETTVGGADDLDVLPDFFGVVVRIPIDSIKPAPENDLVYRPVRPDDPDIRALAESIKKHGLQEPIVVTRDNFILSGHRRHMACRLAGLETIDCRVHDISRYDDGFEAMLVEFNRQRVKGFDEVVREQVIACDPKEAYSNLIQHRRTEAAKAVIGGGDFLEIGEAKGRSQIGDAKWPMLLAVRKIMEEQAEYWPLSNRSIHYDLLNDPPLRHASKSGSRYRNDKKSYKDLCDLLTRARLFGHIPFAAISDRTRTVCNWNLFREPGQFVRRQLDTFLKGYWRNLQQSQPNHIEIVGEKNTVESSIRGVASEFCITYTLGRSYCSLDPRRRMAERFKASGKRLLIILILADFDPDGEEIAHSYAQSMRDDFGIDILPKKVCLT
jgi:hypothetical protein